MLIFVLTPHVIFLTYSIFSLQQITRAKQIAKLIFQREPTGPHCTGSIPCVV